MEIYVEIGRGAVMCNSQYSFQFSSMPDIDPEGSESRCQGEILHGLHFGALAPQFIRTIMFTLTI